MTKVVKASEIDERFDAGEDVSEFFDTENPIVEIPGRSTKRVNIDFPQWMVDALDQEADALAISRQAVVKTWIAERIRATA